MSLATAAALALVNDHRFLHRHDVGCLCAIHALLADHSARRGAGTAAHLVAVRPSELRYKPATFQPCRA